MSDEKQIFAEALGIAAPDERRAFLDHACGDNAALRSQVQALIVAHEKAGSFLESRPPGLGSAISPSDSTVNLAGTTIGHYKLLECIGEGGMGAVYMAEQLRPVKRRVALKIIKPGLDTKQVIARFEAERQALAMMDHPSIAKVFDGSATESGRPYFVMELVRGVPITEYCDQHQLRPRQRLELFIQVCQAVQHAHQKGIIHRDLKPNNVLITLGDGDKPIPKVIDFGIAKATGEQRLTDRTLFTEFRQLIGTPLYMSPEQAEMSQLTDVDTRSDVYSLGVLLYELLTGTTPFDKKRLAKAAYDEVRRIIREEEPPAPSTRVITTVGQALTTVAAHRQTDPNGLGRLLRGELDWIVMRALEKDRARRYETANSLARDVDRYLADEPVEASPPSKTYRLRKLARRYRGALRIATAFSVILLIATVVSTWQAVRATRAERQLRQQRDVDIADARFEWAKLADSSEQVEEAERGYREVLALRRKAFGNDHADVAKVILYLAGLYQREGRLREAEQLYREAVAIRQRVLPPGIWNTANAKSMFGETLMAQRKFAEAEPWILEAYEDFKALPPPESQLKLVGFNLLRLVRLYDAWGKPEQAAAWRARLPTTAPHDGTGFCARRA